MQELWEHVWGYFKASPKGGMLLFNLLRRDLCEGFLGSWLAGFFLPSRTILPYSIISPEQERLPTKWVSLTF